MKLQVQEAGRYRVDPEIVRSFPVFHLFLCHSQDKLRLYALFLYSSLGLEVGHYYYFELDGDDELLPLWREIGLVNHGTHYY